MKTRTKIDSSLLQIRFSRKPSLQLLNLDNVLRGRLKSYENLYVYLLSNDESVTFCFFYTSIFMLWGCTWKHTKGYTNTQKRTKHEVIYINTIQDERPNTTM